MINIRCKYCKSRFTTHERVIQHYHLFHGNNQINIVCPNENCRKRFKNFHQLKKHYNRNHIEQVTIVNIKAESKIKCPFCQDILQPIRNYITGHFKQHINSESRPVCPILNCSKTFTNRNTFRNHLFRAHSKWDECELKPEYIISSNENNSVLNANDCHNLTVDTDDINRLAEYNEEISSNDLTKYLSNLLIKLEVKYKVSSIGINEIINDVLEVIKVNKQHELEQVQSILNLTTTDTIITTFSNNLGPIPSLLSPGGLLSTSHRRNNFIQENYDTYVAPIEIYIKGTDGKQHTIVYTPLLDTLRALFTNQAVIKDFLTSQKSTNSLQLTSHEDGLYFQSHQIFSQGPAICINAYIDEVNLTDALAAYKNQHKVAGVYYRLLNILPEHRSALQCIQIAILFNSKILSHVSLDQILQPFLLDTVELETKGIFVPKLNKIINGSIYDTSGDNLAVNSCAGVCANFGYPEGQTCLRCDIKKKNIHLGTCAGKTRLDGEYDKQLGAYRNGNGNSSGILGECVFSKYLKNFEMTKHYAHDIAHDLLEGTVPYTTVIVLTVLISEGVLKKKELFRLISEFPYIGTDMVKKPVLSKTFIVNETTGGNASTNWSLIRLLPIILYDKISNCPKFAELNDYWELLMILKDIVDICFSPCVDVQLIETLRSLVPMFRKLQADLFENSKFTIKIHNMEHYADSIYNFGPLVHGNTLRFEGKHAFVKSTVKRSHNFKNPLLHVAKKHALLLHSFLNTEFFNSVEYSKSKVLCIDNFNPSIKDAINDTSPKTTQLEGYTYIVIDGIKYRVNDFVVLEWNDECNCFGQILQLFEINNEIYFVCRLYEAMMVETFHIYELRAADEYELVPWKNLLCKTVCYGYRMKASRNVFISLPHAFLAHEYVL